MQRILVSITGTAPLLQHKLSAEVEMQMESKTKKRAGQPKDDNPAELLYICDNVICQPAEHILQAIIKRLSDYKIQGRGKKSYKEMGLGSLNIVPEFIPHEIQTWTIDMRSVVIPATRGRMIRKRPRFDKWSLTFELQILNEDLPMEVVKSALDDAGREGGIGDYRPRFGRFIVTKFELMKPL